MPGLAERHPPAGEKRVQPGCGVSRPCAAPDVFRQPPEREYREVLGRDEVVAEPWAPELDEERVLRDGRGDTEDTRIDRAAARLAASSPAARPGRPAERLRARGKSFVERTGAPPEVENLRPE